MPTPTRDIIIKKRTIKKKINGFQYLLLFAAIFFITLSGVSYLVNICSPDVEVDVEIGNKESLTFTDEEIAIEEKQIDERLKWIQQEDELPSVAVREPKLKKRTVSSEPEQGVPQIVEKPKKIDETYKNKSDITQERLNANQQKKFEHLKTDFRRAAADTGIVIPHPTPLVNKVVVGNFSTIEEAMEAQMRISREETSIIPFIKAVNNYYIVQVGSFSNKFKADALAAKMQSKGINARVISEN